MVRILSNEETKNLTDEPALYLNNRIVERLDKETSKLRVVFDSAAKYKGICPNDALEKGPNYTNSLFRCFLKWRMQKIAVCGDMSKMFNQISVDVKDQRYHRFFGGMVILLSHFRCFNGFVYYLVICQVQTWHPWLSNILLKDIENRFP